MPGSCTQSLHIAVIQQETVPAHNPSLNHKSSWMKPNMIKPVVLLVRFFKLWKSSFMLSYADHILTPALCSTDWHEIDASEYLTLIKNTNKQIYTKMMKYCSKLCLWVSLNSPLCVQVSGLPVAEVMDTWTKQMGYPVLDLSLSETSAKLTQKRFLLDPKADASQPPSPLGSVTYKEDIL